MKTVPQLLERSISKVSAAARWLGPILIVAGSVLPTFAQQGTPAAAPASAPFTIMSSSFSDGGDLQVKYSCDGKPNPVSPPLEWSNIPPAALSAALIFHDPDAVTGKSMWDVTHWIMWNIPVSVSKLAEGVPQSPQMPDGTIQGKNIRGANGYQGPCPPPGKRHHYTFELYALDTKLDLGPDATRADVMKAMDGHIIGKAVYIVFFQR